VQYLKIYSHSQVVIANTEDNLQRVAYNLNQVITEHILTISVQKIKLVAFKVREPPRSIIVIDNKSTE